MLVFFSMQVGMGLLSPFVGRAADSVSLRWMVVFGGLCFSGALLLVSYAQTLWQNWSFVRHCPGAGCSVGRARYCDDACCQVVS